MHAQRAPTTPVIPLADNFTLDLGGCGTTKGCYRRPSGCNGPNCDALVTWTPRADDSQTYIEFELQGRDNWVALGLSRDDEMVSCVLHNTY